MPTTAVSRVAPLAAADWRARASAHRDRADALTADHLERRSRGERHAIEDLLFEYYATKPGRLRRWHPGIGVALAEAPEHQEWRWYRTEGEVTAVDAEAFRADRGDAATHIRRLLVATVGRAPLLGCFGMHEWAMVYRASDAGRRHGLPLRLGGDGTDAVVEAHPLQCTHFDAFRFFTADATPRNAHALTRLSQPEMEQPGCLHATMDLYKWCLKLEPAVPSDLMLDCFELARDVRRVDMQASPYDVSAYGLAAIPVETPEGKSEYARRQREFSERAGPLRQHLIEICDAILSPAPL